MAWGGGDSYGTRSYGGSPTGIIPTQFPRLFKADQPVYDLQLQSPILTFYDVECYGYYEYFVDFGDPKVGPTSEVVEFDGNDYASIHIERSSIDEAADGSLPEITLTVLDPDRTILSWVLESNGLRSASVRVRTISYADIDYPTKTTADKTLVVAQVISNEKPPSITFKLAPPDFSSMRFPNIFFGRHRCHNDFEYRFTHDYENHCNFPSDEFEFQTIQRFKCASDAETQIEHGWRVLNGTKVIDAVSAALGGTPASGWIERGLAAYHDSGVTARWKDTTRTGFFAFKLIEDSDLSDGEIDVCAKLRILDSYANTMCGILIQSVDDESDWIFYGQQMAGSTQQTLRRVTTNGVSSDSTDSHTDCVLRVRRSGSIWYCYSKNPEVKEFNKDDPDSGWTARGIGSLDMGSSDLRVGIAICPDAAVSTQFYGYCFYLRYFAGGLMKCNRSLTACGNRNNTHQFNGYLGMPDGQLVY